MYDLYDFDFIYQLNSNKNHSFFFYIKIINKKNLISFFKIKNGISKKFFDYEIYDSPISSGWINNYCAFFQSQKRCFYIDIQDMKIFEMPFCNNKIIDIVSEECRYLYSSSIDTDYCDFYIFGNKEKVASYCISKESFVFFDKILYEKEKNLIFKYIKLKMIKSKYKIFDIFKENVIQVHNNDVYSYIYLNQKKVLSVFGFIERVIFIGLELIFIYSSIFNKRKICKMSIYSKYDFKIKYNKDKYFKHIYNPDFNIYSYKIRPNQNPVANIVMLHGGPVDRYYNKYNPLVLKLFQENCNIYLINYPGSSGYGLKFKKDLYGKGGIKDFESIKKFILNIKNKDIPLFLIGDSYGSYLSILLLLKSKEIIDIVKKTYATNAFTDLRHQFLFSASNIVLKKYFPKINSNDIKHINPIDILTEDDSYNLENKLLIINGIDDYYCPYHQIKQFENISKCEAIYLKDQNHFKIDFRGQYEIDNLIFKDIEKNIYAQCRKKTF
jgi:hypothetical protein